MLYFVHARQLHSESGLPQGIPVLSVVCVCAAIVVEQRKGCDWIECRCMWMSVKE